MKNVIKLVFMVVFISCYQMTLGYVPVQVKAFKKSLQDSTKIADCANCDFRGVQDLAGVDAHGAHLPGVIFQPCIADDENEELGMICTENQVSNLLGINLANANMFSSCLDHVILTNADLTGVDLSNSSVQNANLKGAKVKGMITTNSTFCDSVMPDGAICTETWTGQGITVVCRCFEKDESSTPAAAA